MHIEGSGRQEFLGVEFDLLPMDAMLARLKQTGSDDTYRYLITPNVDHLVRLHNASPAALPTLRAAYSHASWCVCDSRVLARLARLRGLRLPVVTGSDLARRVLGEVAEAGDAIAVIGSDATRLEALRRRYPHLVFVHYQPPMTLKHDVDAREIAAHFAARSGARFIFLAVGSPQQELVAHQIANDDEALGTALCIGAAIDFLTGHQRRAPWWLQRLGLEWLYRLASQPRRLWRRYLIEGPKIVMLALRWRPNK